ncbi:MAG TPA: hypothetical protein VGI58_08550 [Streptosporangiaceae bacterium]
MPSQGEAIAGRIAAAAERTVTAGPARLFAAWSQGSPVPDEADRRCEGIADLSERQAHVWQVPMGTVGLAAQFIEEHQDTSSQDLAELGEPQEMVYDGANAYIHVEGNWTGFFLGDRDRPRTVNDPLWPLDALFGAREAAEIGAEEVRGVPVARYRVVIDLGRADAALPAGVTVPTGPFRDLSQIPAEVWLDSAGLCRRIAVVTERPAPDDQEPTWSIVELWDFGIRADIVPPTSAEVVPPGAAYCPDRAK